MKRQEKNEIYSIRKFKVGVGSALIGLSFLGVTGLVNDIPVIGNLTGTHVVHAAETAPKPEGNVIAQGEDGVPWELYENGYLLFKPVADKDTLAPDNYRPNWKHEHGEQIKYVSFAGKVYAPKSAVDLFSRYAGNKDLKFNPLTLDVTNLDTSRTYTMYYMFKGLTNLTTLDVAHFNTSRVIQMAHMFHDMPNLTNLDVTHFDTSKVTDMSHMFDGVSKLTNLDVRNFNTSSVTKMPAMFQRMSELTNLDVTHFDTRNVTDMGSMFSNASKLKNLDVTHFDTSKVTNMFGMFGNTSNLTTLDVTNFDTRNVTRMGWMFSEMSNLNNLDVTHFDTGNVKDMSSMFRGMSNLINLDLTNFDTAKVTNISSMFAETTKLKELKLGDKFKADGIETIDRDNSGNAIPHAYGNQYTDKWHKVNDKENAYTVDDWANLYKANPSSTAGTWVREETSQKPDAEDIDANRKLPDKVETIKPEVVYEKDATREKGSENITIQGKDGQKVTPVTKEKDPQTGKLVEKLGEPKITPATNTIVKVAAKDKVETKIIPSPVRYEADTEKDFGTPNVETKGKDGSDVTTTVYTVNSKDGTFTGTPSTKHTDPTPTIVKVGAKTKVVKKTDAQGRKITETTTYTVDPNTGKVTPNTTISYGDKESTVEKKVVPSPVRYEKDDTREKGQPNITVKGKDGEDQITTTYSVDPLSGEVTPNVGKPVRTVEPTETIIKVAAKDKVETKTIPSPVRYEADMEKDFGTPNVETKGKDGSDVTTTIYTVDSKTGNVTDKSTTKHTDSTQTIVKVGAKTKVVKKTDDQGRKITETKTYSVDPNTGKVTPNTTISYVDKEPTVEKKVVPSPVRYEKDDTREKGQSNITNKGKDGEDQIMTMYSVDTKTGNVVPTVGKPVRTVEPTETVIKVAAKDKVETIRKNGDTIERTTMYTVNPKTGEITEEVTEKLIASNGLGIKPPVVKNNDFSGGVNGEPLVNEKEDYKGVLSGNGLDGNGNVIEPPIFKIPEFTGGANGDLDGNPLINEKPAFDLSTLKTPNLGTGLNDFGPKKDTKKDDVDFIPVKDEKPSTDAKPSEKPVSQLPNTAGGNNAAINALGALTLTSVLGLAATKRKKEN